MAWAASEEGLAFLLPEGSGGRGLAVESGGDIASPRRSTALSDSLWRGTTTVSACSRDNLAALCAPFASDTWALASAASKGPPSMSGRIVGTAADEEAGGRTTGT